MLTSKLKNQLQIQAENLNNCFKNVRKDEMTENFCDSLAEEHAIGSMVIEPTLVAKAIELIPDEKYFFTPKNRKFFKAILELYNDRKPVNIFSIIEKLPKEDYKENEKYLLEISEFVPTLKIFEDYCKALIEAYKLRELNHISNNILNESKTLTSDEIIKNLNEHVKLVENACRLSNSKSIQEVLIEMIDALESKDPGCVITGFDPFPKFYDGDLILLAARPGVGKTSLALNIAANVSITDRVAFFSLEMSRLQLSFRLLSSDCGIPISKFRDRELTQKEWLNLLISADSFNDSNLFISDAYSITVDKIKSDVIAVGNIRLVIIDYLQLIESENTLSNKTYEVSEITRKLKMMAKELNIPILCLSQLSRASEQRNDHKPLLSDLRDSGSIEQDADVVAFLYRPYMYDRMADPKDCECIIAKNRHGITRSFSLQFDGELTKFR